MKTTAGDNRKRQKTTCLVAAALVVLSQSAFVSAFKHTHLLRSDPVKDSTIVQAPVAIRLWFSSPVQIAVTSIRLTDAAHQVVETGKPVMGDGDNPPVQAHLTGPMHAGRYTVTYRTMAHDGHVVRGIFAFTLAAPRAPSH